MKVHPPKRWPKVSRDSALFFAGLVLTINEAVFRSGVERPSLLVLFAGMMGLPVFLHQDERKAEPPSDSTTSTEGDEK